MKTIEKEHFNETVQKKSTDQRIMLDSMENLFKKEPKGENLV